MRALIWLTLTATTGMATAAVAQGIAGPLSSPDAVGTADPGASAAPAKHGPAHRAKAKTTHARTSVPAASKLPLNAGLPNTPALPPVAKTPVAASDKSLASPSDPLSFGMKWNGTNQSGRETRIENLNGNADGVGAALGMKLHF